MSVKVAVYPLSALLGVLCAIAIGCGKDSALLKQADASGIRSDLQQVRDAVDARDCDAASAELRGLQARVRTLRPPVDRDLRRRLRVEIDDKLAPAVATDCAAAKTETLQTTTEAPPPPPTETTPTPTETTPTQTDTTPTETEPPPTETTTPPPTPTETAPPADPGAGTGGVAPEGTG